MNIVIYLIEDKVEDMNVILEKLNCFVKNNSYRDKKYTFQFKALKGTVSQTCYGCEWLFYETEVILEIEKAMEEEEAAGNEMGLLLDVLLTKNDLDYSRSKYYPRASIARDIYSKFHKKLPIYVITAILNFGTQSDIIMGEKLCDRFILKDSLEYPGDIYVKSMLDKYIDMIEQRKVSD